MTSQVPTWRKLVAAALAIVAVGGIAKSAPSDWWILSLPMALLMVSSPVAFVPRLGPQLFARAVWWSNLALGTALSVLGSHRERAAGVIVAFACGGALLVIGRKGLAEAGEVAGYAPAAFRSSLLLLMVFALADAQTFLLFGIVGLNRTGHALAVAVVLLAMGATYVVGFIGLYRLKLWAALLDVAVSAIALVIVPVLLNDRDTRAFFVVVAASHCLVAVPMLVALASRRPLPSLSRRGRSLGQLVVIGGLMLASLLAAVAR